MLLRKCDGIFLSLSENRTILFHMISIGIQKHDANQLNNRVYFSLTTLIMCLF